MTLATLGLPGEAIHLQTDVVACKCGLWEFSIGVCVGSNLLA